MKDRAKRYFPEGFGDKERAIFEAGIALASIYHQFLGTPIARRPELLRDLERAIEGSMKLQPYREDVKVRILDEEVKGEKRDEYDYELLKGRHLDVSVVVKYGRFRVWGRMRYVKELDYTLMYIERIESTKD